MAPSRSTPDGTWTYALNNADADTDALAAGRQIVTDTFTVHGDRRQRRHLATRPVTITITGTNDVPVIAAADDAKPARSSEAGQPEATPPSPATRGQRAR